MSHLLSDIYFFKKWNWLFVLTLFGCQKWGFTMEVENWLLLLENPDNKASVWSCLQLYISCLAWPCPPSQVQCRPHKSHQQAVSQAGILPSKMLQCKNEHVTFECKTFNVWGAHLSQMRLKGAHLTQNLNVWGGTFESNSLFKGGILDSNPKMSQGHIWAKSWNVAWGTFKNFTPKKSA